ncbi:MAG: hypothetical protein KDD64_12980 [Bdellovibrionales bacterium]|nr:hypothetical protein [Bdellovibrionales bacterium]
MTLPAFQEVVLKAFLTPAVRFCLKHNIGIRSFFELTKQCFVHECAEEQQKQGQTVTASSLTVATGLNRREVTRITKGDSKVVEDSYLPRRILNRWEQTKQFTTKGGRPKVLTFEGEESEFSRLVRSVSQDVRPAALLAELERSSLVEFTPRGVKPLRVDQSVASDPNKILEVLAADSTRLIRAVEENAYLSQAPRNAHYITEFDNISRAKIPEIKTKLIALVSRFHQDVRKYLSRYDKDINKLPAEKGGCTVSVTTFSLATTPEDLPDPQK